MTESKPCPHTVACQCTYVNVSQVEIDTVCYAGLPRRMRERMAEAGRLMLTEAQATTMARTKAVHVCAFVLIMMYLITSNYVARRATRWSCGRILRVVSPVHHRRVLRRLSTGHPRFDPPRCCEGICGWCDRLLGVVSCGISLTTGVVAVEFDPRMAVSSSASSVAVLQCCSVVGYSKRIGCGTSQIVSRVAD